MNKLEWNLPRYAPFMGKPWPKGEPLQESWFFKANDEASGRAIWLKFTALHNVPSNQADFECWALIFPGEDDDFAVTALKETYDRGEAVLGPESLSLTIGECQFTQERETTIHTKGHLKNGDANFDWDLEFQDSNPSFQLFPYGAFYDGAFPKRKPVSPFPDARVTGTCELRAGQEAAIPFSWQAVPGMQGHNWGTEHSYRYVWCHANTFHSAASDSRAWFEGYSGKIKIGPFPSPWLTGLSFHPDEELAAELGLVSIDMLGAEAMLMNKSEVDYDHFTWSFRGSSGNYRIEGEIIADLQHTVGLNYYDPDGKLNYCYNSKNAKGDISLFDKNHLIRRYESRHGVAIEFLTDKKHPQVPILV